MRKDQLVRRFWLLVFYVAMVFALFFLSIRA